MLIIDLFYLVMWVFVLNYCFIAPLVWLGIDIYGLVTILQFSFGGLGNSLHEGKGLYIGTAHPKTEPGISCYCFWLVGCGLFVWVVYVLVGV